MRERAMAGCHANGAPRALLNAEFNGAARFSIYNAASKRLFTAP